MKLYEIDSSLRYIYENYVNEETGEVDDTYVGELEQLERAKEEKVEACACVYKECLAETKAIADEIKTLTERKRVVTNKAESLKRYLATNCEGEKYKTARMAISWRKSESVEIDPLAVLDEQYTKVEIKPDKKKIKDALKAGETVDGAELVERQNIQIK